MVNPGDEVVVAAMAASVIVELNEQSIELALLDNVLHLEPVIVEGTLRGSSDQIGFARLRVDAVPETLNHGDVTSSSGFASGIKIMFEVKVETIKSEVLLSLVSA